MLTLVTRRSNDFAIKSLFLRTIRVFHFTPIPFFIRDMWLIFEIFIIYLVYFRYFAVLIEP